MFEHTGDWGKGRLRDRRDILGSHGCSPWGRKRWRRVESCVPHYKKDDEPSLVGWSITPLLVAQDLGRDMHRGISEC
ncbi:hypothetical protein NL676_032162 [Syzygium grande]|nr:hypothetical protein NL676_032162 [Syzygium grande]